MLLPIFFVSAQSNEDYKVELYFFHGDTCPYCAQARPVVAELAKKYPWLVVKSYEVYSHSVNAQLFDRFISGYNQLPSQAGVPAFFLGNGVLMGYNDSVAQELENKIVLCHAEKCPSPLSIVEQSSQPTGEKSTKRNSGWALVVVLVIIAGAVIFWIKKSRQ